MSDELPGELVEAVHPDVMYWPEVPAGDEDQAVALAPHEPFLSGTFALYITPEGGFVLTTESERGTEHHVMPAAMVRLAQQMAGGAGGAMGKLMRKMMGG